jgi:hypothetical protein
VTVFTWRRRHAARSLLVIAATLFAVAGPIAASSASAAPAAKVGYVRLAHLSPDTDPVNVYLDDESNTLKEQVFKGVAYGTVSGYLALPEGTYSVSMRAASDPNGPILLTTKVTVLSGHAYTVAGVGKHVDLGLRVIADDLLSPMNGKSKVRIVQASMKAPVLDVAVKGGETIANGVQFATTTPYTTVTSGNWTIEVTPSGGGSTVTLKVKLSPDSVYSLLILDGKSTLTADLLTDAGRAGTVPQGAVPTGAGGSQTAHTLMMPAVILGAVALLGAGLLVIRRRNPQRWGARPRRADGHGSPRTL